MKSILLIAENYYPEEFGINDLVTDFVNRGIKVTVLTQTPSYPFDKPYKGYKNKLFQKETINNINIYRLYSLMWRKKSFIPKTLSYLTFSILATIAIFFIKKKKYDSIFVYQVGPLTQIIPALFSKLFFKNKITIWILDLWPYSVYGFGLKKNFITKSLLNILCKISYIFSDNILVSNEGFIKKINYYVPTKEIHFIPQWIPKEIKFNYEDFENKFDSDKINFLFAGNIGKVQNLENIITCFSDCPENIVLNIVGDGSNLENLKNLSIKLNSKNVIFHGRVPFKEISNWLLSSDILIISLIDKLSFNLTVPAKFQAYLGAFKPIFGVINGETSRIIKKYKLGLASDANNLNSIKENIINFSKENSFYKTESAKKLLKETYNFNIISNKVLNIIEK